MHERQSQLRPCLFCHIIDTRVIKTLLKISDDLAHLVNIKVYFVQYRWHMICS
jgi:hypothetical protein